MQIGNASEHFESVRDVLSRHRGPGHAITINALAEAAGVYRDDGSIDRRTTELVLQLHKDDFPFIVVGGSKGMFVATQPEDLNHELRSRVSRVKNIMRGYHTLKRKAEKLGWRWENNRFTAAPKQQTLFD